MDNILFDQVYKQVRDNGIHFELASEIFVNSWLVSEPLVLGYEAFTNYDYVDSSTCLPIIFSECYRDKELHWYPYHESTTGLSHLRQINDENQLIYAAFNIISKADTTALINLYNKKNIKIWLNDILVYCSKNNIKCLDDSFLLHLNKGDNFILIEKNALSISFKVKEFTKEYKVRKQYLSHILLGRYESGINIITDSYMYKGKTVLVIALPSNPAAIIDKQIRINFLTCHDALIKQMNANLYEMVKVDLDPSFRGNLKINITTMDERAYGVAEIYLGDVNGELDLLKSKLEMATCDIRVKNDLLAQIHDSSDIYNLQETTIYEKRMLFEEEIKTLLAHMNFLSGAVVALENGTYEHDMRRGVVVNSYLSVLDDIIQNYYAYIPPLYDNKKSYPVLVMLKYLFKKVQIPGFAYLPTAVLPEFIAISPSGRGMNRYEVAGEIDLIEAIEDLAGRYNIDRNRIYLMGFSMGGGACWNLAQKYPGFFCGIVTLSSNLNKTYNCNLTNTKIVNIVGELDRMVDVKGNNSDIWAYREEYDIKNVESVILKDTNHFALYNIYNDIKIFEWISDGDFRDIPQKIHFRTDNLRHNRSYWFSITDVVTPSLDCEIKAEIIGDTIFIQSGNVREIEIDASILKRNRIRCLSINGKHLVLDNYDNDSTLVVRYVTQQNPVLIDASSLTLNSNYCGLGIAEIYFGKSCVISCFQTDGNRAKFLRKISSSFSRPIYYADYREQYCEIPIYDARDIPPLALLNNFITIGTRDDAFIKNICAHKLIGKILESIHAEIPQDEIFGMIVKFPNIYAHHKRAVVISIEDDIRMTKYKKEDILKAKFNPPLTGKRDLMRHDAVIFTEAGIQMINFGRDWEIEEILSL